MLSPAHNDWLIALVATRTAELRVMRDIAQLMYRAGHPQVLELARQVTLAESVLAELRAGCGCRAAA